MRRPLVTICTVVFLLCALAAPAAHAGSGGKSKGHKDAKDSIYGDARNDGRSTRGLGRALERDDAAVEHGHGHLKSNDGDDGDAPTGKASDGSGDDAGSSAKGRGKGGGKSAAKADAVNDD